jgi:transcription elongation factor GreA
MYLYRLPPRHYNLEYEDATADGLRATPLASFFLQANRGDTTMVGKPVPLTKEGLEKLQKELEYLQTVKRAEMAQRIHDEKELVGAQNTPEYEDARNEQAFIEGRILTLENVIQNATLISEAHDHFRVGLGSSVTILNHKGKKDTYTIVGSTEADPKSGKISNESPVGMALLGKKVGDEVMVKAPAGSLRWTVVGID